MRQLLTLSLLFTLLPGLCAEVLCPRVRTEHTADVTDLGRFRQYHRWKEKQGEELAIAVWQYLCGPETGFFHMDTVKDGPDPWDEYSTVRDPIKLMNIYNVGYCGIFGPVLQTVKNVPMRLSDRDADSCCQLVGGGPQLNSATWMQGNADPGASSAPQAGRGRSEPETAAQRKRSVGLIFGGPLQGRDRKRFGP
jgi:hypothetical protein